MRTAAVALALAGLAAANYDTYPVAGGYPVASSSSSSSAVATYPVESSSSTAAYPTSTAAPSSSAPGYPVGTPAPYPTQSYPVTVLLSLPTFCKRYPSGYCSWEMTALRRDGVTPKKRSIGRPLRR
ncbi:hypothetical protein EV127DRAFT_111271 [Xylaria flabelliformis]|nr:hypothetical protein EV127DRAFT_111271 [Xylaria flabelliformis]